MFLFNKASSANIADSSPSSITFVSTSRKDIAPSEDLAEKNDGSKPIMNVIVTSSAQSSADTTSGLSPPPSDQTFIPENKGLVGGICTCYNNHFDLDLTPDVVWLSILQQFSAYINGGERAEALRDRIVDFQGKKELVVCAGGSLFGAPYSLMTNQVAEKITENIKDPTIREWADPGFSTSTLRDKVAASVSLMSIMQNYFTYSFMLMFGIPTVTLKGTQKDWEKLRLKVDRLLDFDLEDRLMTMLHEKLSVVCDNFVSSRKGEADLDVWDTVCHKEGGGSGPSYLGGWITCFNLFDHKGELAIYSGDARFGSSYTDSKWWKLDTSDISDNVISVSISVNDNGIEYSTRMFIGTFVSNFDVDIDRGVKEARALKKQNILGKKTVVGPRTDYTLVVQGLKEDVEKLKSKKEAIEKEKEDAKDDTSSKAGIWRHAVQGLKNKVGKLVK